MNVGTRIVGIRGGGRRREIRNLIGLPEGYRDITDMISPPPFIPRIFYTDLG